MSAPICCWVADPPYPSRCQEPAVYEGVQDKPCPDGPPLYCIRHGDIIRRALETRPRFGCCYCDADGLYDENGESVLSWVIGLQSVSAMAS
jgi:hypothetical protein